MKEYVQQGFEAMNENIGGVEKRLTDKIEAFEDRTFSPDFFCSALMVIVGQGIFRDLAYFFIIADVIKAK